MSGIYDDELTSLWRHGASTEPDPEEVARFAGRAMIRQLDRFSFTLNALCFAVSMPAFILFGWTIYEGLRPDVGVLGFACVGFVFGHVWWQQRDLKPVDPGADGRAYQAAMLARLDRHIHLAATARYWFLPIPFWILYVFFWDPGSPLWFLDVKNLSWDTVQTLTVIIGAFVVAGWGNERSRWGVPRLRARRASIKALYGE